MISPEIRQQALLMHRIGIPGIEIIKRLGIGVDSVYEAKNNFTRLVILADLHSGHRAGLTPPEWQWSIDNNYQKKFAVQQKESWDWYSWIIDLLQPIDRLVVNGDAIEGKGPKSGGTELVRAARDEQVEMAYDCISICHAPKIILTRGTPYHTGINEDWENCLGKELEKNALVEISDHAWPMINGIQFSIKHKGTSSTVPHGGMTPLEKNKLWNQVWSDERGKQPKADIIIRSHTHRFGFCGREYLAISTPALQGWGSKFGQRQCEGTVHYGLIWMDIPKYAGSLNDVKWECVMPDLPSQKVEPKAW